MKQPSSLLVVEHSTLYVSSFLDDAVLQTSLPLTPSTEFRVFAHGSYCTPELRRCGILSGPWGLAHSVGKIFVASFGSDQILVFEASTGRFLDALGDSDSLDSPEGIVVADDGLTLFACSFLDSRIVAFDLSEGDDGVISGLSSTIVSGLPVDLDYLADEERFDRSRHGFGISGRVEELHGPEGILTLGDGRLVVSSYYNQSVLIIDPKGGSLVEVVTGPAGILKGPMGLALDDPCHLPGGDECYACTCLLVAAYKSRDPGHISRFVWVPGGGWQHRGPALASRKLRGPSAVALLSDGSVVASAYDSSTLLVFNSTSAKEERSFVLSVGGALKQRGPLGAAPGGPVKYKKKEVTPQKKIRRRRLGGDDE